MTAHAPLKYSYRQSEAYYLKRAQTFERWAVHFADHESLRDRFLAQAAKAREIARFVRNSR